MSKTHKIFVGGIVACIAGAILLDLGIVCTAWCLIFLGVAALLLGPWCADF